MNTPATSAIPVRQICDAQNLTMSKLADELNISRQMVYQWESGASRPDNDRVLTWINDQRQWVRVLGLEVFHAMYPGVIPAVLSPQVNISKN